MYIKYLKIDAFGTLRDREIELSPSLNIIEGNNESGKSALAMFIKFMFYGLSGKSVGGELSERRRYVNWDSGTAGGMMLLSVGEREYRIERSLSVSRTEDGAKVRESARESVRVFDAETNMPAFRGEVPGEALLGVPESIFMNTVFVRQIDGTRPSGTSILSSIENLLFSADESIGTDKALDRLDAARKQILYKNGSGGLLAEAQSERSRLAAALREAQEANASLLGAEEEVSRSAEELSELRQQIARQEKICEAGETALLRRRFDMAISGRRKLAGIREELEERRARGVDRAYLSELGECRRTLSEQEKMTQQLQTAVQALGTKLSASEKKASEIEEETANASALAESFAARRRTMRAAAITLFLFSILTVCGGWLLAAYHISLYPVLLAFAGVLAVLGIVALLLCVRASGSLRDLLRDWGADSIDLLPAAVAESMGGAGELMKLRAEKQQLDVALADTSARLRDAETRARTLLSVALTDGASADASLADALSARLTAAEAFCTETEEMESEANKLEGRLTWSTEQLSSVDEEAIRAQFEANMKTVEGRIASTMDAAKLDAAKKELGALRRALHEEESGHHTRELHLASRRATSVSPAELAGQISQLDVKIERLQRQHDAYCLAIDTLRSASQSVRESVLPRVVAEACASANRISGGTFDAIGIDHGLAMTFTRGTKTREVECLSEGTKDVAYISLRRALSHVLFGGAHPPLIYDESFARLDETRLSRLLAMLSVPGEEDAQSIVLTCRHLERALAAEIGGANTVRL